MVDFSPPPVPDGDAPTYIEKDSIIIVIATSEDVSIVLKPTVVIADIEWNNDVRRRLEKSRVWIDGSKKNRCSVLHSVSAVVITAITLEVKDI